MHELAEHLKAERLKQGLTVEFISEKTRISPSMINALESGEFDRIGVPLIIRAFIRNYCDALGLESMPLMERYGQHIGSFDRQGKGFRKYREWCRSLRRQNRSKALLIILLALLAVGTLIGGAWFSIWLKRQQAVEKTGAVYPSQELPSDLVSPQGGALASAEGLEGSGGPSPQRHPGSAPSQGASQTPRASALEGPGLRGIPAKPSNWKPFASEVLPVETEEASDGERRPHVLSLVAIHKARVSLKIDDQTTEAFTMKAGEKKELEVERVVDIELRDGKSVRIKWDDEIIENSKRRVRLPVAGKEQGAKP
jgi:cytoskeleton protein RodZ